MDLGKIASIDFRREQLTAQGKVVSKPWRGRLVEMLAKVTGDKRTTRKEIQAIATVLVHLNAQKVKPEQLRELATAKAALHERLDQLGKRTGIHDAPELNHARELLSRVADKIERMGMPKPAPHAEPAQVSSRANTASVSDATDPKHAQALKEVKQYFTHSNDYDPFGGGHLGNRQNAYRLLVGVPTREILNFMVANPKCIPAFLKEHPQLKHIANYRDFRKDLAQHLKNVESRMAKDPSNEDIIERGKFSIIEGEMMRHAGHSAPPPPSSPAPQEPVKPEARPEADKAAENPADDEAPVLERREKRSARAPVALDRSQVEMPARPLAGQKEWSAVIEKFAEIVGGKAPMDSIARPLTDFIKNVQFNEGERVVKLLELSRTSNLRMLNESQPEKCKTLQAFVLQGLPQEAVKKYLATVFKVALEPESSFIAAPAAKATEVDFEDFDFTDVESFEREAKSVLTDSEIAGLKKKPQLIPTVVRNTIENGTPQMRERIAKSDLLSAPEYQSLKKQLDEAIARDSQAR